MKNIWKLISDFLFKIKSSKEIPDPCANVIKELEDIRDKSKEYNPDDFVIKCDPVKEEETSPSIGVNPEKIPIVFDNVMGTSMDYLTGKPLVRERPISTGSKMIQEYPNQCDNETVKSGYLRTEDTYLSKPSVTTSNISFFDPEDNKKEIILNEEKSNKIKSKKSYKKKKEIIKQATTGN